MKKLSLKAKEESSFEAALLSYCQDKHMALGRSQIRTLIVTGLGYINGKRCVRPQQKVQKGQTLHLYWDPNKLKKPVATHSDLASEGFQLRILYEDDAVICFDKPAGLPTQPTVDGKRANLFDLAKSQTKFRYLGLHHRLDRDTSGVVLLTKQEKVNGAVSQAFSKHLCQKEYVALVRGSLERPSGRLETFLGSIQNSSSFQKFGSVRSGGKKAITSYSVLEQGPLYSLVEVAIETGRTHQIRVHLSEMGNAVAGDTLYGAPPSEFQKLGRFLLHAHALTFPHPVTGNRVRVESPVPPLFRQILQERAPL